MCQDALAKEDWETLTTLLPDDWRELGRSSGALQRLRGFSSEDALLRTLLLHVAHGYSLRETAAVAASSGLANVSDVALLKRFRSAGPWFRELSLELMKEAGFSPPGQSRFRMRMVDATHIRESGPTGSCWRVHYALDLPQIQCSHFALLPTSGVGRGESFRHFEVHQGDCMVGDRGYAKPDGVGHVTVAGGYSITRYNPFSMNLYDACGGRISFDDVLEEINEPGQVKTKEVWVHPPDSDPVAGRLVLVRRSEQSTAAELRRINRKASKKQYKLVRGSRRYAKYLTLHTTLPAAQASPGFCLKWYRLRWQIELMFKRLKSLAGLGHLPKRDPLSSEAWLYGKLLVGLLTEKLIRHGESLSPWGYPLRTDERENSECMA